MSGGADCGFYTLHKLEKPIPGKPDHVAGIPIEVSLASIAISLKRIADELQRRGQSPKVGQHHHQPFHVKMSV